VKRKKERKKERKGRAKSSKPPINQVRSKSRGHEYRVVFYSSPSGQLQSRHACLSTSPGSNPNGHLTMRIFKLEKGFLRGPCPMRTGWMRRGYLIQTRVIETC